MNVGVGEEADEIEDFSAFLVMVRLKRLHFVNPSLL
jgi:hypothetical protein